MQRTRMKEKEKKRESVHEQVYINKPREKTPKIILAREEINPGCGSSRAREEAPWHGTESEAGWVPKRRLTGWVLGSKLN